MQVSVVIAVYNAIDYIEQAVESALMQPETAEVILVEDCSTDNSLAICHALADKHTAVRVLQHPNGENKGAAASRNLGIINAHYDFISFLDADDYYLPDRFTLAKSIFESDPTIEGVYGIVGMHYENDAARQEWKERHPESYASGIFSLIENTPPDELFDKYLYSGNLFFHGNALTVRKSALLKVGLYSETRLLVEDIVLCYKLAAKCKLVAGSLEIPVAKYRIHGKNGSSYINKPYEAEKREILVWYTLWQWSMTNLNEKAQAAFMYRYISAFLNRYKHDSWVYRNMLRLADFFSLLFKHPHLIAKRYFWRNLQPHRR